MRKAFILAFANIRKAKGQAFTLFLVLIIAALILQCGLALTLDYSNNFDRRADMANSEDVVFSFQTRESALIDNWQRSLRADARTKDVETQQTLCHTISYAYGKAEMNCHVVFMPSTIDKKYGTFHFLEKTDVETADTCYLPYLFKVGGGYKTGDKFVAKIKGQAFTYTVGGFYESALIGSFNGGVSSVMLAPPAYRNLDENTDIQGVLLSVKLKDRATNEAFSNQIGQELFASARNLVYNSIYFDLAKSARTLTANICSLIFIGLALLITLVSLVVTAFRITNNIDEDMRTYGTLEAMGYTSRQIIGSVLTQFIFIGLLGAVIGIACSYAFLPALNLLLMVQSGLIWQYGFMVVPIVLTLGSILFTVALTALLSCRRIKRLQPIQALRQGISTHSFRRNYFPLEKTRGNATMLLSLKSATKNMKQNVTVFVIGCLLAFMCVFMSVMLNAFTLQPNTMLSFFAGEISDAAFYTSAEDAQSVKTDLAARDETERVYRYQTINLFSKTTQLYCYLIDDSQDLNNPEMCFDGRMPKHDNEIALSGVYAKNEGYKIGESINISQEGNSADYVITGFIQSTNNLGKDCLLLYSGYVRLNSAPLTGGFYVDLKDGVDVDTFITSVTADFNGRITVSINLQSVMKSGLGTYTFIVSILVILLGIISLCIIALVLYLLVKTLLIRKKRDYGILKALGYTTNQLILQTALAFMPAIILASVVGALVGALVINPMLSLLFGGIGILKASFPIPVMLTLGFNLIFIGFAFGIAALVSSRVRRITPRELIAGE